MNQQKHANLIGWVTILIIIFISGAIAFSFQERRMSKALSNQKDEYERAAIETQKQHESEISNLQDKFNDDKNKLFESKRNLSNTIENLQTEYAANIKNLESNNDAKTKRLVILNGFYFVYGIFPDDKNKEKIQQFVDVEFNIALLQKCVIYRGLHNKEGNLKILNVAANRINIKLGEMRGLAKEFKFQIPKQDYELSKKIKDWGPSNSLLPCFE